MKKRFAVNIKIVYFLLLICFGLWMSLYLSKGLHWTRTSAEKIEDFQRKNRLLTLSPIENIGSRNILPSNGKTISLFRQANWDWKLHDENYVNNLLQGDEFCNGSFIGYQNKFAKLIDVVVDPKKGSGKLGGENMSEVMNQSEDSEYYKLEPGYFLQRCNRNINYLFNPKSHVNDWFNVLKVQNETYPPTDETIETWTIAVQRYEYANLYHTMTDFYNTFLLAKAFQMTPGNITVFWIDGHPSGGLDKTWEMLFGKILRSGSIRNPVHFRRMIWGIMGYDSPLNKHSSKTVPYLEEFREFVLTRHGIPTTNEPAGVDCKKIKVLFIWRRDYVAHPRNPSGSVSRKIKNEDELILTAKEILSGHDVTGVQIDKLTMTNQLKLISTADILIGMHGAGLSHTLFLPKHAGVIEFYPTYWSNSNIHFQSMARWRKLHYSNWVNADGNRELPNHLTIIDTDVFKSLLIDMKNKMCS